MKEKMDDSLYEKYIMKIKQFRYSSDNNLAYLVYGDKTAMAIDRKQRGQTNYILLSIFPGVREMERVGITFLIFEKD